MNASKELEHILRRRRERADVDPVPQSAPSRPSPFPLKSPNRSKKASPHPPPKPKLSTLSHLRIPSSRQSPRHLRPTNPSPSRSYHRTPSPSPKAKTPSSHFPSWIHHVPPPPPPPGPPPRAKKKTKEMTADGKDARKNSELINHSYVSDESESDNISSLDNHEMNSPKLETTPQQISIQNHQRISSPFHLQSPSSNPKPLPTQMSSPLRKALLLPTNETQSANSSYTKYPTIQLLSSPLPYAPLASTPAPILNPLNGNILCTRQISTPSTISSIIVEEINPANGAICASTNLNSIEFIQECSHTLSLSLLNIQSVLSITCGIFSKDNQYRLRVALALQILSTSHETQNLIAIYHWGGSHSIKPIRLSSILPPPTMFTQPTIQQHHGVSYYTPTLLQIHDSRIFMGGSQIHIQNSNKSRVPSRKACVYIRSYPKTNAWKTRIVEGERVTALSIHPRKKEWWVVATDQHLGLYTYEDDLRCRGTLETQNDMGVCHQFTWSHCSTISSPSAFCFLAASFSNCVLIYWIPPMDSYDTSITLSPIAVFRPSIPSVVTHVSWMDLGPRIPPGIVMLSNDPASESKEGKVVPMEQVQSKSRLTLGILTSNSQNSDNTITNLYEGESNQEDLGSIQNILFVPTLSSILCQYDSSPNSYQLIPSLNHTLNHTNFISAQSSILCPDLFFTSHQTGIASSSLGLDSKGKLLHTSNDGVYHIVTQCSSTRISSNHEYTPPKLLYWLCHTMMGDHKDHHPTEDTDDDECVTRGARTKIVCDATIENMIPFRLEERKGIICVLYAPALGCMEFLENDIEEEDGKERTKIDPYPVSFSVVDSSNKAQSLQLYPGRDVVLFPMNDSLYVFILNRDGSTISLRSQQISNEDTNQMTLSDDISSASISSMWNQSEMMDSVDWYRLISVYHSNSFQMLFVGTLRNHRSILTTGPKLDLDSNDVTKSFSEVLPLEDAPSLLLEPGEGILSIISLPQPIGTASSCFAIATQMRVMILTTSSLQIKAMKITKLASTALVPLGSHSVAFVSKFGNGAKVEYLCCLKNPYAQGVIATLPLSRYSDVTSTFLFAIRPDRFVYATSHASCQIMEALDGHIRIPIPSTKPVLLLEPLLANALCEWERDGFDVTDNRDLQSLLREIIDNFGRRNTSFPHAPKEGIGLEGMGITTNIFEMLNQNKCFHAASFLLTGNVTSENMTPKRILPSWIPLQNKLTSAGNDARPVLMTGNSNLVHYVTHPEEEQQENLLDSLAPPSVLSNELGLSALRDGQLQKAVDYLDMAGSTSSERLLLELALSTQLLNDSNSESMLNAITDDTSTNRRNGVSNPCEAISALALDLRRRKKYNAISLEEGECSKADESVQKRMKFLAPSLRRGGHQKRMRDQLINFGARVSESQNDPIWMEPQKERYHVWHRGPFEDQEELLLLETMEEWLGRRQPAIVGKEGVALAAEAGENILADILLAAAREEKEDINSRDSESETMQKKKWVEGIGEGREDEENLSLYLRFSEGDSEEDNNWTTEGILDLTKHSHKAIVYGNESTTLEPTTSSVDEGEAGKIKSLYDLVFQETFGLHSIAGLAIDVKRGDSLDIGILHARHPCRQRCSIEFWFYLPEEGNGSKETVLVRRTLNFKDQDMSKFSCASNSEHLLWELVLLPTGQLQFRTSGGSIITSGNSNGSQDDEIDEIGFGQLDHENLNKKGIVSWRENDRGGWNHACVVFSPPSEDNMNSFNATLFMKGAQILSSDVDLTLPSFESDMYSDFDAIDDIMDRSILLFGLSPISGFRLTEIRVWSCARNEDDIKLMMYEYLSPAEAKKKFKVKIRKKKTTSTKSISLLPSPARSVKLSRLPVKSKADRQIQRHRKGRATKSQEKLDEENNTRKEKDAIEFGEKSQDFPSTFNELNITDPFQIPATSDAESAPNISFNTEFKQFAVSEDGKYVLFPEFIEETKDDHASSAFDINFDESVFSTNLNNLESSNFNFDTSFPPSEPIRTETSVLNDSASSASITSLLFEASSKYLSQEVRKGAASAIIRGPPATRHFGGNRGGLISSFKNWKRKRGLRKKAPSIAICGTDKTVIYSYGEDPSGFTFPSGASGAIMSDVLDDKEYICCYTVKDKKLNIYDIKSNSPVMGLQMPTKLNFWRFLPPETHCNTLVILLITPLGGFHWMPIGKNPQPKLIWKRNSNLQRKKILTYEEGGCNGAVDSRARSTVAIILMTSTSSHQAPIEAWCVPFAENSTSFCISSENVLGAAFFCPSKLENRKLSFTPMICLVKYHKDATSRANVPVLQIFRLIKQDSLITKHEDVVQTRVDVDEQMHTKLPEPIMATGSHPPVFILCLEHVIVIVYRRIGLILAYMYDGDSPITKLGQKKVDHFVVDASIQRGDVKGEIQVILLLSLLDGKDGFVAEIQVSQVGVMC